MSGHPSEGENQAPFRWWSAGRGLSQNTDLALLALDLIQELTIARREVHSPILNGFHHVFGLALELGHDLAKLANLGWLVPTAQPFRSLVDRLIVADDLAQLGQYGLFDALS